MMLATIVARPRRAATRPSVGGGVKAGDHLTFTGCYIALLTTNGKVSRPRQQTVHRTTFTSRSTGCYGWESGRHRCSGNRSFARLLAGQFTYCVATSRIGGHCKGVDLVTSQIQFFAPTNQGVTPARVCRGSSNQHTQTIYNVHGPTIESRLTQVLLAVVTEKVINVALTENGLKFAEVKTSFVAVECE